MTAKYVVAAFLWFCAAWITGAFAAWLLGTNDLVGPLCGLTAGSLFVVDAMRRISRFRVSSDLASERSNSPGAQA